MAGGPELSGERRRPTGGQIRRRRTVALAGVVVAVGVAIFAVRAALPHTKPAPPPTTAALPPPPQPFHVVFPEGFTRTQMAARVSAVAKIAVRKKHKPVKLASSAYLAATKKLVVPCFAPRRQAAAEGFLFPATYPFFGSTTSKQLVQQQIVAFCRNWKQVNLAYARSKNLTPYDVLTIASLVQGEAVVPGDRAKIAAVIYNRLHLHMALGIDAALRYALDIPGTESIHESQLRNPTPYNLRLHQGLPPTPIDNPGLASLQAAAHPAKVDYLYFAAEPDKKHHFFTASATAFQQYECAHGYGC
ncbi:MAG TPA: endolytic transglycosylase MltG [Gaiellaceae bacterium]|nr:endolytic transglycosylase MltG [Gaiellaceae bacterium]